MLNYASLLASMSALRPEHFSDPEFSIVAKNTLRWFCKVRMPSGMIIADIGVPTRGDRAWAAPPSEPRIDRSGMHMKGPDGKLLWDQLISFTSREQRDRWSDAVIAAVRHARPEVFDELEMASSELRVP